MGGFTYIGSEMVELGRDRRDLSKQLEKFSRELAQSTGVDEKDVQKILHELGVSEITQLSAPSPPKQILVADIRMAVKRALDEVMQ